MSRVENLYLAQGLALAADYSIEVTLVAHTALASDTTHSVTRCLLSSDDLVRLLRCTWRHDLCPLHPHAQYGGTALGSAAATGMTARARRKQTHQPVSIAGFRQELWTNVRTLSKDAPAHAAARLGHRARLRRHEHF